MSDHSSHADLAYRFGQQLSDPAFRAWLAEHGYGPGADVMVVNAATVIDCDVLRRTGQKVVQEAAGGEFGWRVLPE